MNYDHAFHAGNAADVMKHAILALLLERLRAKPTPFCVLDTHAGAGRYDLAGEEAARSGEAAAGIARLWPKRDAFPELALYLDAVAALNAPDDPLRFYPGSPLIAAQALRDDDRLMLVETAERPVAALHRLFARDRRVAVHQRDGWEAVRALLPPAIAKRGLVLIDPPFEAAGEFMRLGAAIGQALRRWPSGIVAAWYPIKDGDDARRFHADLSAAGHAKMLCAELSLRMFGHGPGLSGTGMVIANAPWRLDEDMSALLPRLADALGLSPRGVNVAWLTGERTADEA